MGALHAVQSSINEDKRTAVVKFSCRQLSSKMLQLVLSHCCLVGREVDYDNYINV